MTCLRPPLPSAKAEIRGATQIAAAYYDFTLVVSQLEFLEGSVNHKRKQAKANTPPKKPGTPLWS